MKTQIIPANNKGRMIRDLLTNNGGRMFSVTFTKADGTERTITGNYGHVKGQDGENTVAHIEKYVTVILPERDANGKVQRRNVNTETVKSLRINGVTFEIKE
jgi:hypothetical protein